MSDLVGNPEDRFSHNEAHIILNPGVSRGSRQNLQRSFLPCLYVYPRDKEDIDMHYYKYVLIESNGIVG